MLPPPVSREGPLSDGFIHGVCLQRWKCKSNLSTSANHTGGKVTGHDICSFRTRRASSEGERHSIIIGFDHAAHLIPLSLPVADTQCAIKLFFNSA